MYRRFLQPPRTRQAAAALLVAVLFLSFTRLSAGSQPVETLRVSFINVGQGDAVLLQDPSGFDVLIDGGRPEAGPTVVAYLRQAGLDDLDVLVASHADSDHIGGLIAVLSAADIPVEALVYNGYPGDTATWDSFLAAAAARGLTPTAAQFPQSFTWGEMAVQVLHPPAGLVTPETNAASLVLRVDYGEVNFLFTGDIDSAVEDQILARVTPAPAEILKVAHHGSRYGSGEPFLAAYDPADAVIQVGKNSYGHPAPETIERLADSGAVIWRTDRGGNIVVVSDGLGYTVSQEYQPVYLPQILLMPTPIPTQPPVSQLGRIAIRTVYANGSGSAEPDEYVEIENVDDHPVWMQGWTLRDKANHVFTFTGVTMQPGAVCRVYTDQDHPEWCGFNYRSASPIWNNGGDCAYLRDPRGEPVSEYCYP